MTLSVLSMKMHYQYAISTIAVCVEIGTIVRGLSARAGDVLTSDCRCDYYLVVGTF